MKIKGEHNSQPNAKPYLHILSNCRKIAIVIISKKKKLQFSKLAGWLIFFDSFVQQATRTERVLLLSNYTTAVLCLFLK